MYKTFTLIKEISMDRVFTIEQLRPIKDGMTISRDAKMGTATSVTFFSLGKVRNVMTQPPFMSVQKETLLFCSDRMLIKKFSPKVTV
jgi:hypothetical protein